jgi:hypothetical protein
MPARKKISHKNYLVIGTADREYDQRVLNVLAQVQKYTKSSLVHTGALSDIHAIAMYNHRIGKLQKTLARMGMIQDDELDRIQEELDVLVGGQDKIINDIESTFDKVTWVTNDKLIIPDGLITERPYFHHLDISSKLSITPVAPAGDKRSGHPISNRSIQMYRYYNNSVVCPHPIIATRLFARDGINHTLQFLSTGALRFAFNAKRQSETFEHFSHPSAILITHDPVFDRSYYQRIYVDIIGDEVFAVWDGLLFTETSVIDVDAEDRMGYITDTHGQVKNQKVWLAFLDSLVRNRPGFVCHGGDLGDMPSICPHETRSSLARDGLKLKDDLDQFVADVTDIFDTLDTYDTNNQVEVVTIESNHHGWLNRYINDHKELDGLFGWKLIQDVLSERRKITIREDAPGLASYCWGDMRMRHGHSDGSVTSLAATQEKATNGHYHTHEEFMNSMRIGCSCDYPPYMVGQNDRWVWQIATGTKYKGVARIHAKTVLVTDDGTSYVYRGEIVKI